MRQKLFLGTLLSAAMLTVAGAAVAADMQGTKPGAGDRMYEKGSMQGQPAMGASEVDKRAKPTAPGAGDRMYEKGSRQGEPAMGATEVEPKPEPKAPGAGDRMYENQGTAG